MVQWHRFNLRCTHEHHIGPVVDLCKHINEPSGCTKYREFFTSWATVSFLVKTVLHRYLWWKQNSVFRIVNLSRKWPNLYVFVKHKIRTRVIFVAVRSTNIIIRVTISIGQSFVSCQQILSTPISSLSEGRASIAWVPSNNMRFLPPPDIKRHSLLPKIVSLLLPSCYPFSLSASKG
jgi:hypothetical protein